MCTGTRYVVNVVQVQVSKLNLTVILHGTTQTRCIVACPSNAPHNPQHRPHLGTGTGTLVKWATIAAKQVLIHITRPSKARHYQNVLTYWHGHISFFVVFIQ